MMTKWTRLRACQNRNPRMSELASNAFNSLPPPSKDALPFLDPTLDSCCAREEVAKSKKARDLNLVRKHDNIMKRENMRLNEERKLRTGVGAAKCGCEGCGFGGSYVSLERVMSITQPPSLCWPLSSSDSPPVPSFDNGIVYGVLSSSNDDDNDDDETESDDDDDEFDYLLDELEGAHISDQRQEEMLGTLTSLHTAGFTSPLQVLPFLLPPVFNGILEIVEVNTVLHLYRDTASSALIDAALIRSSPFFPNTRFLRIDFVGFNKFSKTFPQPLSSLTPKSHGIYIFKGRSKSTVSSPSYTSMFGTPGYFDSLVNKLNMVGNEGSAAPEILKEVSQHVVKWMSNVGLTEEDEVLPDVRKACLVLSNGSHNDRVVKEIEEDTEADECLTYCNVDGCGKAFEHTHVGVGGGMVNAEMGV